LKPALKRRYFFAGYNLHMVNSWRIISTLLFLVSAILFSSTYLELRDAAIVPYTTTSGHAGTVTVDLPRRVFAGDRVKLTARVALSTDAPDDLINGLAGRLAAGFEELSPVNKVTLNVQSGSDVEFIWRLRTASSAQYPATLWLWLLSDSGEELLMARDFALDSRSYLGLGVSIIRIAAGFLFIIALLAAGFDLFLRSRKQEGKSHC